MSSLRSQSAAWWANSPKSARGAVLGATILIGALTATSIVVWTSPSSPAAQVGDIVGSVSGIQRLTEERDTLEARLASVKAELSDRDDTLDGKYSEIGRLEAQLAVSEAKLADYKQQLAEAKAGSSKPRGSGSGSSAKPAPPKPPADPTITAPPVSALLDPATPYFGLYTEQAPFNWATFDATATKVGSRPDVAGYFAGWDQNFRPDAVERSWKRGMLPMMTWESRPIGAGNDEKDAPEYALPRILAGDFDAYLRQYARDIVATGLPLAIRLNHEMNGDWYPWSESVNGNSPGQYAQMWRHVHDIFEQEGANSLVIWTWAPNRVDKLDPDARDLEYTRSLYPGDEYVDWVGMSSYLRPPFRAGQEVGFEQTYDATLAQLRDIAPGKPIMLAEVGASEAEGRKVEWLTSFFAGVNDPANSDIIGFAWFNLAVTSYVEGELATNDWRIDARQDSVDAFRTGLLGPGTRFVARPL